jgi:hypothetical protein
MAARNAALARNTACCLVVSFEMRIYVFLAVNLSILKVVFIRLLYDSELTVGIM